MFKSSCVVGIDSSSKLTVKIESHESCRVGNEENVTRLMAAAYF